MDFSSLGEDDRKYHDWVIEHNYRFHQFYGNMALALFFAAIILGMKWFYLMGIISGLASSFSFYRTVADLKQRFGREVE